MDRVAALAEFAERGYTIVDAQRPEAIDLLLGQFLGAAGDLLGVPADQLSADSLHDHVEPGDDAARFRLGLTQRLVESHEVGATVFEAFEDILVALLGTDVLSQRVPNIVFQPPQDPHPTELHRDAPANSPYEVVVWLPLVDCFGTKSMYLLDRTASAEVMAFYRAHPDDRDGFQERLMDQARFVEVGFGQALLFWSGLFHGSVINTEAESRLSINTRYKHLFAPLGMKDPFRYFEILRTSPLTRLGLDFQRSETFGAGSVAGLGPPH
jgi:sporadic carbohydrate cluster 2OG-Fe(II) oxygenase